MIEVQSLQISPDMASPMQKLRERQELERLEIRHDIASILTQDPILAETDSTFLHWTTLLMQNSKDEETAIYNWRNIFHRGGRNKDAGFSPMQQAALDMPDEKIETLYGHTRSLIDDTSAAKNRVAERIKGYHQWNDEYETRQRPKRSLMFLRTNGLTIRIAPEDMPLVRAGYIDDESCPILDKVKNQKIASINGIEGSKISLTIHDIVDHFWIYEKLDALRILERYSEFLRMTGNPQNTDIYKREGELIASVGFEWRSSHLPERQFFPTFNLARIIHIFEKIAKHHDLSDNQQQAVAILSTLDPQGNEAIRLGSIYSGILVELMEQRRKSGFIRKLDEKNIIVGNLSLLDPEYLALVVEINHMLCNPESQAEKIVLHSEAVVENYLEALAQGTTTQDLVIRLQDIECFSFEGSRLNPQRQQWLKNNLFHTATRTDACD